MRSARPPKTGLRALARGMATTRSHAAAPAASTDHKKFGSIERSFLLDAVARRRYSDLNISNAGQVFADPRDRERSNPDVWSSAIAFELALSKMQGAAFSNFE